VGTIGEPMISLKKVGVQIYRLYGNSWILNNFTLRNTSKLDGVCLLIKSRELLELANNVGWDFTSCKTDEKQGIFYLPSLKWLTFTLWGDNLIQDNYLKTMRLTPKRIGNNPHGDKWKIGSYQIIPEDKYFLCSRFYLSININRTNPDNQSSLAFENEQWVIKP
jgi:hypothetical protein